METSWFVLVLFVAKEFAHNIEGLLIGGSYVQWEWKI
jgi:hypothetical protein